MIIQIQKDFIIIILTTYGFTMFSVIIEVKKFTKFYDFENNEDGFF